MAKTDIDSNLVRRLANLLKETGLSELEYEVDGMRVRVARQPAAEAAPTPAAPEKPESAPAPPVEHPGAITAPMVGTAYRAPEPDAPPFVEEGDNVEAGQTLLIIEAMKVMNPIPAPRAGVVTKILFENAQPVEFGDVLAILE